ncbi:MAG TPA: MerR family transcriptional regulator [Gemmatimonadales bacterium]|jgi:DNA-binding transcriptional MerR regulator
MTLPHPVQQFFSIGEVCALTDLKPHVLRYWESQFRFLNPAKNRSGNRVYKAREVELIMLVKHLLYTEKFTIDGARQRLDHYRQTGEIKAAAKDAMRFETVNDVRRALADVLRVLDGGQPVETVPAPTVSEPAESVSVRSVDTAASVRPALEDSHAARGTTSHGEQLTLA